MCYKENKTRAGVDASTPGRGTDAQPWSVLETEPLSCDVGLESNLAPILENCRMRSYHCIESNLCTWMHARVHRGTCKHSTCKRVSAAVDVNVCAGCVRMTCACVCARAYDVCVWRVCTYGVCVRVRVHVWRVFARVWCVCVCAHVCARMACVCGERDGHVAFAAEPKGGAERLRLRDPGDGGAPNPGAVPAAARVFARGRPGRVGSRRVAFMCFVSRRGRGGKEAARHRVRGQKLSPDPAGANILLPSLRCPSAVPPVEGWGECGWGKSSLLQFAPHPRQHPAQDLGHEWAGRFVGEGRHEPVSPSPSCPKPDRTCPGRTVPCGPAWGAGSRH